ncbi:MAG TPA: MFS transporter [Limnochordia bacterium]|nr:MFS transporter [Limnochordia bacterium]
MPPHFRSVQYNLLMAGLALSYLGDAVFGVGVIWLAYSATGSATVAGFVYACEWLPSVIMGPIAGTLVDSFDRRRVMVASDLARALILIGAASAGLHHSLSAFELYVIAFLLGTASTVYLPALRVLLRSGVDLGRLASANATIQALEQGAIVLGSGAAGFLIAHLSAPYGALWTFLFDGLSFVAMALLLIGLRLGAGAPRVDFRWSNVMTTMRNGVAYVRSTRALIVIALMLFAINFIVTPVNVILPAYSEQELWAGAQGFGLLLSLIAAGVMLVAPFVTRIIRRLDYRLTTTIGIVLMGVGFEVMGAAPSMAYAAVGILLVGASMPVTFAPTTTWIQRNVPFDLQGRTFATNTSIARAALPIAFAGAGLLVRTVDSRTVFYGTGFLLFAIAIAWDLSFAAAERRHPRAPGA